MFDGSRKMQVASNVNKWLENKIVGLFPVKIVTSFPVKGDGNLRFQHYNIYSKNSHSKLVCTGTYSCETQLFDSGMDLIKDGWFHERCALWPGQAMTLKVEEVLYHGKSDFQDILVFKSTDYGIVLVLDGVINVTEKDECSYQEMVAHVPLYGHPNPEKVLIIGGGDGGVLREVCKHSCVKEVTLCDIDGDVIKVSKKYLPFTAVGYEDPRVTVKVMDGAKFMEENQGTFDVVLTDSSDPDGPASVLFESPFYKGIYRALREGGICGCQGECLWLHSELIRPLMNSIGQFFSTVEYSTISIPTYPCGQIGIVVATKGRGKVNKAARKPTKEEQKLLRYYTSAMHGASFVLPAFTQRALYGTEECE